MKEAKTWEKLDEHQQKFMEDLEAEVNDVLKGNFKGVIDQASLDDAIAEAKKNFGTGLTAENLKAFTDMQAAVKEHAAFVEKFGDKGITKDDENVGYVVKILNDNEDKYKKSLEQKKGIKFEIPVKSIVTQAASDIATHTIGQRVDGIGQQPVRQPFMKSIFRIVPCSLEYIKYIDQETVVRDAKNVASAAASSHTTKLTWKERSIQTTNVRDLIDIPLDMMNDYDFVEGEMRNLIESSVQLKIDNGLLKDDGVYPNLHSVNELASEFSAANTLGGTIEAWTAKVQTPNIFDLIIAMSSQIVALGQDGSFMPDTVLFNTIDRYKSILIKDKNDQYILPPFVTRVNGKEFSIEGMRVMSNPNVTANSLYVLDSTKGTIYQRKTAIMEISYENSNNFEVEVATLKGYERLNLLIRNVNANAFMKCSDIDTALTAIRKP